MGIKGKKRSNTYWRGTFAPPVVYNKWVCGGTLINLWYVVTAAHCQGGRNKISAVRLGDWEVGGFGTKEGDNDGIPPYQEFEIEPNGVIVHEHYKRTRKVYNDIALIKLPRKAIRNGGVQMACLPLSESRAAVELRVKDLRDGLDRRLVTVIGWGYSQVSLDAFGNSRGNSKRDSEIVPTRKQQFINIPVVDESECHFNITKEEQFCAGGVPGKDACRGDSGSGVFAKDDQGRLGELKPYYLLGIVSSGSSDCTQGLPGVYTRVSEYIDWIRKNIK